MIKVMWAHDHVGCGSYHIVLLDSRMTFRNEAEATTSERVECHPSGHVYLLDQRNILWCILNMKATWSQKPKFGYLSGPFCFYSQWLTGLFCTSVFFSLGFLEWMVLIPKQGLWLPGDTEKVALNYKLELLQSTKSIWAPPGFLFSHRTCEWMCAGRGRIKLPRTEQLSNKGYFMREQEGPTLVITKGEGNFEWMV